MFQAILAQAQEPQPVNPLFQFLPFILLFAGMYFLLIRPQQKKQKEHQQMITQLKPGDKVITAGGLCGTITHVKKDRFQLKVDDSTRVDVLKTSVQSRDAEE